MFKKINNQHLNFENALINRNISKGAKLGKMLKSAFLMSWRVLRKMKREVRRRNGEEEKVSGGEWEKGRKNDALQRLFIPYR